MPNTSSALKKEENRRLRAERGRSSNFFKLTLCMGESYPTIYGSIGPVCLWSLRQSSPAKSRMPAIPAAPAAMQPEALPMATPPRARTGVPRAAAQARRKPSRPWAGWENPAESFSKTGEKSIRSTCSPQATSISARLWQGTLMIGLAERKAFRTLVAAPGRGVPAR